MNPFRLFIGTIITCTHRQHPRGFPYVAETPAVRETCGGRWVVFKDLAAGFEPRCRITYSCPRSSYECDYLPTSSRRGRPKLWRGVRVVTESVPPIAPRPLPLSVSSPLIHTPYTPLIEACREGRIGWELEGKGLRDVKSGERGKMQVREQVWEGERSGRYMHTYMYVYMYERILYIHICIYL